MITEADIARLFDAARDAQAMAYAPYSKFNVGAALITASGAIYSGCNVENAAYPQGTCAEAGAIATMVRAGERVITAALVVGDGDGLCTPCGGCRQRLREFAAGHTPVLVAGAAGVKAHFTLDGLLPASFGPHNLGV